MLRFRFTLAAALVVGTTLTGCAANLPRSPTSFTPAHAARPETIVIANDTEVTPSTGYTRTIKAGSTWTKVGVVPQGEVFKIENDVFLLEGAHMHEAYSVIKAGRLVGFYLPFEQAFVVISPEVPLSLKNK